MSKTLGLLLASSLAATSALPALAGGLDDAIIEAPVVVEPAPPAGSLGLGGLGAAGAVVGGLVALGIIAAVIDDDEDDDDAANTTLSANGEVVEISN